MTLLRNLVLPIALVALPALLSGCGAITVEKSADIARPAETVFTYIATAPAATPFGSGATLTVKEAANNEVKGELTVGEKTIPVTFTVSTGGSTSTLVARAEQPRFGGGDTETVLQSGLDALSAEIQNLKTVSDLAASFGFGDLKFEVTDIAARPFLYIEASTPNDAGSIKNGVLQSMTIVDAQIRANGLVPDGAPIAVETEWNEQTQRYSFQAGRPYRGSPPTLLIAVKAGSTPGGTAIRVPYEGPEENVIGVYDKIETMIAAARLQKVGGSFEVYLDDPTQQGGSVKREIYHIVTGDAQRLTALFPNNKAPVLADTAPAVVGTVAGAPPPAPAVTDASAPAPAPAQ